MAHWAAALLSIACFAWAGAVRAQDMSPRDPAGTVGVQLLDLAPDTIGLRYRMRVNACVNQAAKKIIFVGVRTVTPGAPHGSGAGTLELDVMTDWVEYEDDLGHAGWPEQGIRHLGEPSLWLRNVDYGGVGRVGLRPLSPSARALFPRQCAGIDRVGGARASLTSIAAIHQGSILGRDIRLTLVRQPLRQLPVSWDWGHRFMPNGAVTPILPAGRYWPWLLLVEMDGARPAQLAFLVDESRGQYIAVDGGVSIRTEYFLRPDVPKNVRGDFQLYVWDVETLREGAGRWEPRPRWAYGEDLTPTDPAVGYGFRVASYTGRPVLEVSYFSLGYNLLRYPGYYAQVGDVLDLGWR
ncbi:MAG TPA: hypothetical protein VNO26_07515 [Candidatus Limnocylindria bacterium]|nr:hypothetical protein [Candidatus Limnocylindria bacterium]